MHPKIKRLFYAAAVLTFLVGSARGGPLLGDGFAMLKGQEMFTKTLGSFKLIAKVEYAVYAPGQFNQSALLDAPPDPSGGDEYVYAYEIFNDQGGNRGVENLSVSLGIDTLSDSPNLWHDATTPELGDGPDDAVYISDGMGGPITNVKWIFLPNRLLVGTHSDILLFTSPYGPAIFPAVMNGQSTVDPGFLPSPVPEPSTLVLSALAALSLPVARYMRRRKV